MANQSFNMKVLWDHQCFSMQRFGGISRNFASMYEHIGPKVDVNIPSFIGENEYIEGKLKQVNIPLPSIRGKVLLKRMINNQLSIKSIKKREYSVFHATYYDPYFVEHVHTPFVITVHDMIHELHPELLPGRDQNITAWKKTLIGLASGIICVSEAVKSNLIQIYPEIDD